MAASDLVGLIGVIVGGVIGDLIDAQEGQRSGPHIERRAARNRRNVGGWRNVPTTIGKIAAAQTRCFRSVT